MKIEETIEQFFEGTLSEKDTQSLHHNLQVDSTTATIFQDYKRSFSLLYADRRLQLNAEIHGIATESKDLEEEEKQTSPAGFLNKVSSTLKQLVQKVGDTANEQIDDLIGLVAEQFSPYPAAVALRGHAQVAQTPYHVAMQHYRQKEYQAAIAPLDEAKDKAPYKLDARFYLGVCYLQLQKPLMAIAYLEDSVEQHQDRGKVNAAEWYLALAHLADNNVDVAKLIMERILSTSDDRFYQMKAKDTLEKIGERSL